MSYSVTSWFIDQCAATVPTVKNQFLIGTSDYSDYVLSWPSINVQWNNIKPLSVTINLANDGQVFNFIKEDKTNLRTTCYLKTGFTHPTSGDEFVTLHSGTITRISYDSGKCAITVTDKLKQLSERVIGSTNSPVVMSSTTQLPSDLAWWLCTSYGGLSSIQSTSNPDIDYSSWLSWAAVFSADSVNVGARFEGKKVLEGLRSIGRHTRSAIFMSNGKLTFNRFTTINTNITSVNADYILGSTLSIADDDIINKQYVQANYIPSSDYWTITVFDARTSSINSYGLRENMERDESFWYVSSANAINLAQREMFTNGVPIERYEVTTQLKTLPILIGETIVAIDDHLSVAAGWRMMEKTIDMNTFKIKAKIDGSQINTPFTLDVSALDGADLLL